MTRIKDYAVAEMPLLLLVNYAPPCLLWMIAWLILISITNWHNDHTNNINLFMNITLIFVNLVSYYNAQYLSWLHCMSVIPWLTLSDCYFLTNNLNVVLTKTPSEVVSITNALIYLTWMLMWAWTTSWLKCKPNPFNGMIDNNSLYHVFMRNAYTALVLREVGLMPPPPLMCRTVACFLHVHG